MNDPHVEDSCAAARRQQSASRPTGTVQHWISTHFQKSIVCAPITNALHGKCLPLCAACSLARWLRGCLRLCRLFVGSGVLMARGAKSPAPMKGVSCMGEEITRQQHITLQGMASHPFIVACRLLVDRYPTAGYTLEVERPIVGNLFDSNHRLPPVYTFELTFPDKQVHVWTPEPNEALRALVRKWRVVLRDDSTE